MGDSSILKLVLLFESLIPNPNPSRPENLLIRVKYYKERNNVSVKKNQKTGFKQLSERVLDNSNIPPFSPSGAYDFETTDIAFKLFKCPYFRGLPEIDPIRTTAFYQKIRLNYGGVDVTKKWWLPREEKRYSAEMNFVINVSKELFYEWENIKGI